jgi:hypothetical protein
MAIKEIFEAIGVVVVSLGGAGFLIIALSGWLGKVWADRVLQDVISKNERMLEELKKELDLLKQKELTRHFDKLAVYKDMIDFLMPVIYEGKKETWADMRIKADALLNSMRLDLGVNEGEISYRGNR